MQNRRCAALSILLALLSLSFSTFGARAGAEVHDVAVTKIGKAKSILGQGWSMKINVTVVNQGDVPETFNVTLMGTLNTSPSPTVREIGRRSVSLNGGYSTIVTFVWSSVGFSKGNYTLTGIADSVSGETNTTNNVLTQGFVIVAMAGDFVGGGSTGRWPDGRVDIRDLASMCRISIVLPGYPPPKPDLTYDIDDNGKVEIKDLSIAAKNYGRIDP